MFYPVIGVTCFTVPFLFPLQKRNTHTVIENLFSLWDVRQRDSAFVSNLYSPPLTSSIIHFLFFSVLGTDVPSGD